LDNHNKYFGIDAGKFEDNGKFNYFIYLNERWWIKL